VERSLKPSAEFLRPEPVPLGVVSPAVPAARPPVPIPSEGRRHAPEQPEPLAAEPPTLPEASPPASLPGAQPLPALKHA
jgi:hypothetical protein